MILLSGPAIARLGLHTRKWAHEQIQRGAFGPVTRGPSGVLYVELSGVCEFYGRQFNQAEIDRAVGGQPDRILIVAANEVAT
jgi:hypothetical protein